LSTKYIPAQNKNQNTNQQAEYVKIENRVNQRQRVIVSAVDLPVDLIN